MPSKLSTILLADDHGLVRKGFRRMLEDEPDLRVVGEASDGIEAVRAAKKLRPDIVVMDFALPGLNGAAATKQILAAVPRSAVLILSMYAEPSYVRDSLEAGAQGYLMKDALDLNLADAVREIATGRQVLDSRLAHSKSASRDAPQPLTPRELQVLRLIVQGQANKDIAVSLGVSINTVAVHRANIMRTLDVHSTSKLVFYALSKGLVVALE